MSQNNLARISRHTAQTNSSVPLLRRSSAGRNRLAGHCLCQAVAHSGEKCGLTTSPHRTVSPIGGKSNFLSVGSHKISGTGRNFSAIQNV